ncbi:MAG TPA: hypothetical protein VF692_00720, partial [Pyrinomonadaceae bacterium]
MKVFDFLIIYLACGAPVGVYFYLQNHRRLFSKQLWLKTILNFLFWIPLVLQIIRKSRFLHNFFRADSDSANETSAEDEKRVYVAQKRIENIIGENKKGASVYEFREVCDRFVGLSLAVLNSRDAPAEHEKEIFRIAFRQTTELSARCYHRRNRKRLFLHQIDAEKDFLQTIDSIAEFVSDRTEFCRAALEIVTLLKNERAQAILAREFAERTQTERMTPVKQTEKDLWISARRLPPNAQQISMDSPTLKRITR